MAGNADRHEWNVFASHFWPWYATWRRRLAAQDCRMPHAVPGFFPLLTLVEGSPLSTTPPAFEALPAATYPLSGCRMAAPWRRALAFLVDAVILCFSGFLLGYVFFDLLMGLGTAGLFVGYLVGLFYFASPESSFGKGQSFGKRLARIQVVDRDGSILSIERSCLRYTVFAIPWFVYGLPLQSSGGNWAAPLFFSLAVFGLGGASLYLIAFTRNTRQSIHDLVVGSYVVEAGREAPVKVHPVWKAHWIFAALVFVVSASAGVLAPKLMPDASSAQFADGVRQVEQLPGVKTAVVRRVHSGGNSENSSLVVDVHCTVSSTDEEALANQVADSLLTIDPRIDKFSTLRIVLIRGYDIGIAHSFFSQTYSDSPAAWKRQFFGVPPQLPRY
jgi:uncharacterized RDD family membrane protein YckC